MYNALRDQSGQALIEFAFGLPLLIAASLLAFGLIDAATTQEAIEAGTRRASAALAGTNDDGQVVPAATTSGWLRGQRLGTVITPPGTTLRCVGSLVTVRLTASGHLGFLLPVLPSWSASQTVALEDAGPQREQCVRTAPPPP